MIYLLLAIHILVCVFIVIVVLLQSGKSADVAAAFGGHSNFTVSGRRGVIVPQSAGQSAVGPRWD